MGMNNADEYVQVGVKSQPPMIHSRA